MASKKSLGYAAIVSEADVVRPAQGRCVGGPSASRDFSMVALWIPNSRSIALRRVDSGRGQDRTLRGKAPVECAIDGWS